MDYFLCLETATEVCSVALGNADGNIVVRETSRKNSHTETITIFIRECMDQWQIDFYQLSAIGISQGPGSYTGLRVGTSTAKGIAFAHNIPLIGIDTLYGLAYGLKTELEEGDLIMPMIDARRMEVYTAIYDHQLKVIQPTYNLILQDGTLDHISEKGKILVCGNGAVKAEKIKTDRELVIHPSICSASHLITACLAKYLVKDFVDIAYFSPFYLKSPNITKPKKKQGLL